MEAVNKALKRSLEADPHAITFKTKIDAHAHGAAATVAIGALPHLRNDCGLAVGDVIQNFRAALDHLAWDLVRIGLDPDPKKPQNVQFPMATSYSSYQGQIRSRLPGVPVAQLAVVRRFQPYRRGDGPTAVRWLRNLSDKDKHRVLIPTLVNVRDVTNLTVNSSWPVESLTYLVAHPRPLNLGTQILRVELKHAAGECQVNVDGEVTVFPSLGYGRPITTTLASIRTTVLEILTAFDEAI
jgi:hypothetical protein